MSSLNITNCQDAADNTHIGRHEMMVRKVSWSKQFLFILMKWQRNYATRKSLDGMTDHALRDIGLTRNDVDSEYRKWFWQ
ncbi:hypothetical protein BCU70_08130 [Vibrio sp. 10N.286.49.C2]|uniref:DUF1127 domain-containing protein n=1 Tax=unclassified Vibrio TaxID=2614977 RepID=UPI000CBACC55|nr:MULTISPECIES: DUF1127 domain-containing protein [unclassified Vibrio]PMH29601.1 hypothetical protein BCU70_08130 [Vibrio sp. 10N.286.49.C2]PMH56116.1 hypothetical protein BCU66_08040 [Vibrio sp. 10N.286.49.B1]PMH81057.1 hypothetical protein BCU58_03065 [Vibrio sp. 10N.286.48.B7]